MDLLSVEPVGGGGGDGGHSNNQSIRATFSFFPSHSPSDVLNCFIPTPHFRLLFLPSFSKSSHPPLCFVPSFKDPPCLSALSSLHQPLISFPFIYSSSNLLLPFLSFCFVTPQRFVTFLPHFSHIVAPLFFPFLTWKMRRLVNLTSLNSGSVN